jgi:hypothetical protein
MTFTSIEEIAAQALHSKQLWLDWAEIFDAWRVVPRTVLFGMGYLTWHTVTRCLDWFTHLPATERSYEEAGAAVLIIGSVSTVFKYALDSYINSGRQWTK